MNLLKSLTRRSDAKSTCRQARFRTKRSQLRLDVLEAREVPAYTAVWDTVTHELRLTGTSANDTINPYQMNGNIFAGVNVQVRTGGAIVGTLGPVISSSLVSRIVVNAGAGNDMVSFISVNGTDGTNGGGPAYSGIPLTVRGGAGADTIWGGSRDDLVDGGTQADEIHGGDGLDTLRGGDGNDTLLGGYGGDNMYGGVGNDLLEGADGWDELQGDAGNDVLHGGNDGDFLNGGAGIDQLYGDAGNDFLVFSRDSVWLSGRSLGGMSLGGKERSFDLFDGGEGVDHVAAGDGNQALLFNDRSLGAAPEVRLLNLEWITMYGGNDLVDLTSNGVGSLFAGLNGVIVQGANGNDTLVGNELFPSQLRGGANKDRLIAGNRSDTLDGGTENDTAVLFAGQVPPIAIEAFIIKVPTDQPQNDNWSCGPNSASRLLRAYGIDASYSAVRSFTRYDGNLISRFRFGTPPGALRDSMKNWKSDSNCEEGVTVERVLELLRAGKPVIAMVSMRKVSIFGGHKGVMHYVVLNGYDAVTDRFTYTDTTGAVKSWSRAEFEDKWNWQNHFTGPTGNALQSLLQLAGLRNHTILY